MTGPAPAHRPDPAPGGTRGWGTAAPPGTSQGAFRRALLDAAAPVPAGLTDPLGRPDAKRFAVYRNNVAVSLTEALRTGFPVVRKLVGDVFFDAMAGVFLRAHPPASPVLQTYGEALPAFLERFEPASALPYLPDIARLELMVRRAYHAEDATPDPSPLSLPPERLMAARLTLAPAARAIASPWPVLSIWRANTQGGAAGTGPEEALVGRPGLDPVLLPLPPGGAAFTDALRSRPFGEAVADGLDLQTTLAALLEAGAITGAETC